jgi:putative endonuclease
MSALPDGRKRQPINRRQIGTDYESCAAEYLKAQGYEIVERNFRCRTGEIDIIAREGEYLCFVEVKYRAGAGCGSPLEAVNYHKRQKILGVAKYYMMCHGLPTDTACRMDVVAIEGREITLLRNAFGE